MREQGMMTTIYYMLPLSISVSIQHSTTYVKKLIEDNSPIEETFRFLGVSVYILYV